jgi:hypothetical protein
MCGFSSQAAGSRTPRRLDDHRSSAERARQRGQTKRRAPNTTVAALAVSIGYPLAERTTGSGVARWTVVRGRSLERVISRCGETTGSGCGMDTTRHSRVPTSTSYRRSSSTGNSSGTSCRARVASSGSTNASSGETGPSASSKEWTRMRGAPAASSRSASGPRAATESLTRRTRRWDTRLCRQGTRTRLRSAPDDGALPLTATAVKTANPASTSTFRPSLTELHPVVAAPALRRSSARHRSATAETVLGVAATTPLPGHTDTFARSGERRASDHRLAVLPTDVVNAVDRR